MKRSIYTSFIALLLAALTPLHSEGAELIIQDAGGITRAAGDVSQSGNVEFSLRTRSGLPAEGEEISLTNPATGDSLASVASGGTARFEGVAPGTWTVTSASEEVIFNGVTVMDEAVAAFGGAAGAGTGLGLSGAGVTAAGVGAAAIGVGAAAASGGGGSSLSASQ